MSVTTFDIFDGALEFYEDGHQYLFNGICIPSITQVIKARFGHKYDGISKETLQRASEAGTRVHEAIEAWCKEGKESDLQEVRNFRFLQKQYGFEVIDNECPVVVFRDGEAVCAGRLDLVLMQGDRMGLGDIKRTSTLDKEYLAYQLNLYRIGYRQTYGIEADFLAGLHLRENVRKYVPLPINEGMAWDLIDEWREKCLR